jgi:hypothetical protein
MPVSHFDQVKIDAFFSEIAPYAPAYTDPTMRYLAVRGKEGLVIFHGVVALCGSQKDQMGPSFETADVVAQEVSLRELDLTPTDVLRLLLTGTFELAGRTLSFPADHSGNHSAFHAAFDGAQWIDPHCAGKLVINGSNNHFSYIQEPKIYRQLKVGTESYDSLAELAAGYRMKFDQSMNVHFEFHAARVAEISDRSILEHGRANIGVRLPSTLDRDQVCLSMRLSTHAGVETKLAKGAADLTWDGDGEGNWLGTVDLSVPNGDAIDCILSYAGFAQHHHRIEEAPELRNTLRLAFQLFDDNLCTLGRVIENKKNKDRDARALEQTVSALLAMRGFKVINADHIPDLQDIPDILASDTRGNLMVVECTLELPNAKDKLAKLFRKFRTIRDGLDAAGLADVGVSPVLAVAIPKSHITAYYEEARKAGILLWSRESLDEIRNRIDADSADDFYDAVAHDLDALACEVSFGPLDGST